MMVCAWAGLNTNSHTRHPAVAQHAGTTRKRLLRVPAGMSGCTLSLTVAVGVSLLFRKVFLSFLGPCRCNYLLPASRILLPRWADTSFAGHQRFSPSVMNLGMEGDHEGRSMFRGSRHRINLCCRGSPARPLLACPTSGSARNPQTSAASHPRSAPGLVPPAGASTPGPCGPSRW